MKIEKLMKDIKSWKTTAMGFISGLMLILPQLQNLLDGNPETVMSETVLLSGLALMGFGITAKDGDKSTEDVS